MPQAHKTETDRRTKRFSGPACVDRYETWFSEHPNVSVTSVRKSESDEKPYFEIDYYPLKARLH